MKLISNKLVLAITALMLFGACQKYEEYNENPNEPTEVSPDVLLTNAMRDGVNTLVNESFLLGNNAGQLSAKTLRTEVDAYNWNAFPTVWEGLYGALTDVSTFEEIAREESNEQLEGVAIVLRTWMYANLTNAYGDIPYSEAIRGDVNIYTPVYDAQEDIYADMLEELARADDLLAGGGSISGDILLGGDNTKWRKFCNSLRLRLLMTANNKIDDVGTQFAAIVNEGNIMTSNDDNVVLEYTGSFPNEFPLLPLKTGDFDAVALSKNAYDVMKEHNDPRLMRYARPNSDDYSDTSAFSGAVNGSNSANCPKAGSRLGVQYYNYPQFVQANDLGLPQADGIVMTYSEVEFLLAEAAANGWIGSDVETHYKSGIGASMTYYQVDLDPWGWDDFDHFYDSSGVAYEQTTDIWEQKWLALFFHGLEPYFELRRWYTSSNNDWSALDFVSAPCENLNNDMLPMRFLYPGEEQSLNEENYNDAISRLGGSNDQNASMWLVE